MGKVSPLSPVVDTPNAHAGMTGIGVRQLKSDIFILKQLKPHSTQIAKFFIFPSLLEGYGFIWKLAAALKWRSVAPRWEALRKRALDLWLLAGLCSTNIFGPTRILTHVTTQMIRLWLNSTLYFSWLIQIRLNSNSKFVYLTQLIWLNSFESGLSQIWLTTHHILPNLAKNVDWGGGCGRM